MTRDPYVLTDPTTGRPILMAPRRRGRPLLAGRDVDPARCPLCPGHESATPPEVDAVRDADSAPDTPGWSVRAVPNLYPATTHHEVVVEGAEHELQPGRLAERVWSDALAVHRRRVAQMEAQPGVRIAYVFKNVGARAGASLAHNHTQVIGLPMLPPRLELELAQTRGHACVFCEEARTAEAEGRVIASGAHHVALCPRAPKLPYETWLLPRAHDADYLAERHAQDLAATMHRLFRALDGALGDPPFNMFLHRIPGVPFHWHYELQPRTGNLAGLELGGDMYINVLPGEEAAALLRAGLS